MNTLQNIKFNNGSTTRSFLTAVYAKTKSIWKRALGEKPLRISDKIAFGVLIAIFLFVSYVTLDANKYRTLVHVIEGKGAVGVNPTSEALDFGDLSLGTSAVRRVKIQNGTIMPVYVAALELGSISSLVDIDKNFFVLNPGETIKMEYALYMPASASVGRDYTGRVYLFKVPTFWLDRLF